MSPPPGPERIFTRLEFAAGLTSLRVNADLTVRQLAKIVDTPASTLGSWFSGRHVPPAASTPVVRALLAALGAEDATEEWLAALRRARASSDRRGAEPVEGPVAVRPPAPYRGLASFEPADAELFFGRARPTRQILDRIEQLAVDPGPSNAVLAVVGPSGAGKSSVLRAGVVAAVLRGDLDGPGHAWSCEIVTPNQLAVPADPTGGRILLVVDQFEEIFTSVDPARRDAVLDLLSEPRPGRVVVVAMRADFYAEAAAVAPVQAALQHAQVLIGPMSADELTDAVRLPAIGAGVDVEDGLVDVVLADLKPAAGRGTGVYNAGALPLLSHALLAAWDRSDGRRLTVADYRATGGLDAAVQTTAEDAYAGLTPTQQDAARAVFLRLVNLDGEILTTRRRIAADELDLLARDDAPGVITRFVEHRLVTAGDGWYEISHEALLSAWRRLRDWVDVDRAGLVTHRQLTEAANLWAGSGHDATMLLRGARLDVSSSWAEQHPLELNDIEGAFLTRSREARTAEQRAERRRLTRLRVQFLATAVLAVVAIVLTVVFAEARGTADRARAAEHVVRDDALSRAAAFESTELQQDDPAVAQQLAIAAYRIAHTAEAKAALIDESARPTITRVVGQQGPTALAASADGRLIAVSHAIDGTVRLFVPGSGPVPRAAGVLAGTPGEQVFALALSPDDRLLATGGASESVRLWDVADPSSPRLLTTLHPDVTGAVEALAISPDGRTLVAGSVGTDEVTRWDITDPRAPVTLPQLTGLPAGVVAQSVAFDRSGAELAVGTSTGDAYLWPTSGGSGVAPRRLHTGVTTVDAVAFDPVRPVLYTATRLGAVDVWSSSDPGTHPLRVLHGRTNSQINVLAVSADGSLLAAGSSDADLRQWRTSDWAVDSDVGNPGPVVGAAYTRDGDIVSTAADGTLRLQPAAGRELPTSGSTFALVWSANGKRLLVSTNGQHGSAQLVDASDPDAVRRLGPPLRMPAPYEAIAGSGALDASGDLVAAGNAQGRVALWDTTDPARPRLEGTPFDGGHGNLVESLAFSPDQHVLAVAGDDDETHLWDVSSPAHPRELASMQRKGAILNATFSPDGHLLAVADSDGHAYLYRVDDPSRPALLATLGGFRSYAYGVAFSPDGRTLAVADADATTRLFDLTRPSRPTPLGKPLIGPADYDYTASFTPNGRTVAIASNDGTVRLYRADGSDPLPRETLRASDSNLFVASYSPNGTVLAGGGRSDSVTLWSTNLGSYDSRVCRAAGTPITRQEWRLYLPDEPYHPPCG